MKIEDKACMARGMVNPYFVDPHTGNRMGFGKRCNKLSYMSAEAMAAAFGGDPSYIPARIGFIYGDAQRMPSESPITRSQSWDMLKEELSYGIDKATVDVQVVGFSYPPTLSGEKPASAPSGGGDSGSDSSSYEASEFTDFEFRADGIQPDEGTMEIGFDDGTWSISFTVGGENAKGSASGYATDTFIMFDSITVDGSSSGGSVIAYRALIPVCPCDPDPSDGDYNNILPTGSNAITFHAVSNSQDKGAALGTGAFKNGDYIYQAVLLGCHNEKYYIISRVSLLDKISRKYLRKPDKFEVALDWTIVFR